MLHGYQEDYERASATATSRYSTLLLFRKYGLEPPAVFPVCIPPERKRVAEKECAGAAPTSPNDIYNQYLPPCALAEMPECTPKHIVAPLPDSGWGRTALWIAGGVVVAGAGAWLLTRKR